MDKSKYNDPRYGASSSKYSGSSSSSSSSKYNDPRYGASSSSSSSSSKYNDPRYGASSSSMSSTKPKRSYKKKVVNNEPVVEDLSLYRSMVVTADFARELADDMSYYRTTYRRNMDDLGYYSDTNNK